MKGLTLQVAVVITATLLHGTATQPPDAAAEIVIFPETTTMREGNAAILTCVAYGVPHPDVTWSRGGEEVTNTTRMTVYSTYLEERGAPFTRATLEICSLELEDAGMYSCQGSNQNGRDIRSFSLAMAPIDAEECSDSCVENSHCLLNEGKYTCVCASGYTGDGYSSCGGTEESEKTLLIGVGVAIAALALIATAIIAIIVLPCLIRKKKLNMTENAAYMSNTRSSSLTSNAAYITTCDQGSTINTNTNMNEAYGALEVPTSPNQAHQMAKTLSAHIYDYIPQTT